MKAWRKTVRTGLFGAGVGVVATGSLMGLWRSSGEEKTAEPITTILARIQALGELRTVRFTYDNVSPIATSREVADWAAPIPGAASVVENLTRNEGVVGVTGTIDAGVQLQQASARYEGQGERRRLVVEVPAPTVFPARVEARVHHAKRGWLWMDANLGLKAERQAAESFRTASLQQGILDQARTETRSRLTELLSPISEVPIDIRFSDESRSVVASARPALPF